MSGVDNVNISLAGGIVGGALLLTGGAALLLFKGIKMGVVAAGRAAERTHAMQQAYNSSQEYARKTDRSVQAMKLEIEKTNRRIEEAGLFTDKKILALHEDILRAEKQQDERFEKQFLEYYRFLDQQATENAVFNSAMEKKLQAEKKELEQDALLTAEEISKLRTNILHELGVQREILEKEIKSQYNEIANEMQKNNALMLSVVAHIDSIEQIESTQQKYAQYWIGQAKGLLAGMEFWYQDTSTRSSITRIHEDIDKAASDMAMQAYESAITVGRRAFQSGLDLKEQIVSMTAERNKLYTLWQEQITKTAEDIKDDTDLIYEMETSEGIESIPANLDYWTNGKFRNTQKMFNDLKAQFADFNKKTNDEIRKGLLELENINAELAVIRQIAKANFVFSHNRYIQGCHFADIFAEDFGMTDCEGDYEGEEQRGAYIGIYKNPVTKDAVVIKIQPIPDEAGIMNQNQLEVHYFNDNNNEEQREQWRRKINGELGGKVLSCKSCKNLPSDQVQMTNIDWIRKQKQQQANA